MLLIEYCLNTSFKNINEIDFADIKKVIEIDSDINTVSDNKSISDVESANNDIDISKSIKQKKEQYNQI